MGGDPARRHTPDKVFALLNNCNAALAEKHCRVFLSFRYSEAHAQALAIQAALAAKRIKAFVCSAQEGDRIGHLIYPQLIACELFVVMGTRTYGQQTGLPFCTDDELRYTMEAKRSTLFLVKMCPAFFEPTAIVHFSPGVCYHHWQPAGDKEPPPT